MKKIIFSAIAVLFAFTSCQDKNDVYTPDEVAKAAAETITLDMNDGLIDNELHFGNASTVSFDFYSLMSESQWRDKYGSNQPYIVFSIVEDRGGKVVWQSPVIMGSDIHIQASIGRLSGQIAVNSSQSYWFYAKDANTGWDFTGGEIYCDVTYNSTYFAANGQNYFEENVLAINPASLLGEITLDMNDGLIDNELNFGSATKAQFRFYTLMSESQWRDKYGNNQPYFTCSIVESPGGRVVWQSREIMGSDMQLQQSLGNLEGEVSVNSSKSYWFYVKYTSSGWDFTGGEIYCDVTW